ncbi:MAG: hypothetical protein JWQ35_623 [Bacteriovoracaceae bacterium]|nr:hypothetical protein [Bacteriovoracaceae bacterium]
MSNFRARALFCLAFYFCVQSHLIAQSDFNFEELHLGQIHQDSKIFPSLFSGVRSDISSYRGQYSQGGSIGPFIRPALAYRSHKQDEYSFNLEYRFTAAGAEGFGDRPTPSDFSENVFFSHQGSASAYFHLSPKISVGVLSIFQMMNTNGAPKKNNFSIFLNPSFQFALSDTSAVAVAYLYERVTNFDSTLSSLKDSDTANSELADSSKQTKNEAELLKSAAASAQTPVRTLNAGEISARFNLEEDIRLKFSIISGKNGSNFPSGGSYYNAARVDAGAKILKLRVKALYQFNADVNSYKSGQYCLKHRGRLLLAYPLVKGWTINLENGFLADASALRRSGQGDKPKYTDEQYFGILYSF